MGGHTPQSMSAEPYTSQTLLGLHFPRATFITLLMVWGQQRSIFILCSMKIRSGKCHIIQVDIPGITLFKTHLPLLPHINSSPLITAYKLISPYYRIYVSVNWVSIGAGNGLSPIRCQAISWTNARLLSIGPLACLGTNFGEILIKIQNFSFMKNATENNVCEKVAIVTFIATLLIWILSLQMSWTMHYCIITNYDITRWGWVTHIFMSSLTKVGSDNGLSPIWHQAII